MERDNRVIAIPMLRWRGMLFELQLRGQKRRESGAFLLSSSTHTGQAARVKHIAYYDDLDSDSLKRGGVDFHAAGYARLWQMCKRLGMEVVADVHTHPGAGVAQSWIDAKHPMLANPGHIAMILPHYGYTSAWTLAEAGIYEYMGNHQWRGCNTEDAAHVRLCIF